MAIVARVSREPESGTLEAFANLEEYGCMVAMTKADIPDSINSVEALHVWTSQLLEYLHPTLTVVESAGGAERAISSAPWKITASDPPCWRHISRASIQLNNDWAKGGKMWNYVVPLSGAAIPAEFRS